MSPPASIAAQTQAAQAEPGPGRNWSAMILQMAG
jgi:hypothetical protein